MDISLVVAQIVGAYLIISGLFLIFRGKTLPRLLQDFFGHPAVVYLTGIILVFLSLLYLLQNNVWDNSWRTVITVVAWLVLLKGLAYIFIPDALHKMVNKKLLDTLNVYGIVAFVAGLSLFYLG
ncbi:hypothetical protein A3G63_01790 [Candidatus Kaiserbacteria bacterium RIFCSPLOWO2_12_FULL_52_8]|uniref:Integral membrane protein (PIN domain superfamily) n=1 Tax=Candidatus Kaiserbacteria bacterium RIFCSPHIGHO2_01_FULL_53_31 TaxID=1798481 RepID=A0A1F6CJ21_9BACT|nr:MAG: hypothetical protein A2678_02715 [Candidatus Kaiserbacteria bacterium RIFCSPHIGHO2_01_FULL_53_31]OGG94424.1 MAG: hypothetical protein A3G63_01790 [Candidatus Kaiserbacteria bacterium RIFCSPLOWO2_12_FULL_52_8]